MIKKLCVICKKEFIIYPSCLKKGTRECCSPKCAGLNKRGKPNFKRRTGKFLKCKMCGKEYYKKLSHSHKSSYCSKKCLNKSKIGLRGKETAHWKGGISKCGRGYILIYSPFHPFCDSCKYVKRSRLVMEKHIGRFLTKKEVVHHINRILTDDRIENLQLFSNQKEHMTNNKDHHH